MLSTLLNLFYLSSLITGLIVLLILGAVEVLEIWELLTSPLFATYVSKKETRRAFFFRTAILAVIVFFATVILHLLIGGGINAL